MRYVRGNLLNSNRSIAHCVSADFAMGAGIAKTIADVHGRDQIHRAPLYGIGWKMVDSRYILYLVTKSKYWLKPTLMDMELTLINLRLFCQCHNIIELAIPRIGCGLDRLSWNDVGQLVISELEDHGIVVDVYTG